MKEYYIRGRITKTSEPPTNGDDGTLVCPSDISQYQPTRERLRVEVWDRDVRFNDRLAASTTGFSTGIFELRFTDEDFRLEPGESEVIPDVFFQVFRQRQLLFTTDKELVPETPGKDFFKPVDQIPPIPLPPGNPLLILPIGVNPKKPGYQAVDACYRLEVIEAFVREIPEERERDRATEVLPEDTVVDVLPTSDQIFGLGRVGAIATTDNSSGSLQHIVDNAMNRVLGQTVRTGNGNAFKDSLNRAFTLQENNGNKTYSWNPTSYAATQMDLGGAISGAQASLYHRAKAALKEILPILDGIYPLDPAADEQNRDAVRSIVRTEIIELVNEFGVPQGPRVQRVDSLFQLLIGNEDNSRLSEQIGGQLKDFADAFGLRRSRINTVDEERNFGNFLIVKDYIVSLRQSWNDFLSVQQGGGGAFVGTQLVLLSQALSVMAESVRETYRIMDLVFLGPEERQSVFIDFTLARAGTSNGIAFPLPDGTGYSIQDTLQLVPAMDLERLLSWAMRFASEEGPTLARSGGKLGIANVIAKTAERLMILLQAASYVPVRNSAFRRAGALRALRDLAFQTYQVQRLAQELIPPSISGQPDDVGDRRTLPPPRGNDTIPAAGGNDGLVLRRNIR